MRCCLLIVRVILIQLIKLLKSFILIAFLLEIIILCSQGVYLFLELFILSLKLLRVEKLSFISPIQPPI